LKGITDFDAFPHKFCGIFISSSQFFPFQVDGSASRRRNGFAKLVAAFVESGVAQF